MFATYCPRTLIGLSQHWGVDKCEFNETTCGFKWCEGHIVILKVASGCDKIFNDNRVNWFAVSCMGIPVITTVLALRLFPFLLMIYIWYLLELDAQNIVILVFSFFFLSLTSPPTISFYPHPIYWFLVLFDFCTYDLYLKFIGTWCTKCRNFSLFFHFLVSD